MSISIVIPIYNKFHLVNELLVNLNKHTKADEIIIVDDHSTDEKTISGIGWWAYNFDHIKIYRPLNNLGFLKASNYGLFKATGDIICLLSSDVVVEDDLCKLIKDAIQENHKYLIGGIVYEGSTGWNDFDGKIFPYAEGWLLAMERQGWNLFGGFDERYAPNDFEDVDLSTIALKAGYVLHSLNNPKIKHIGAQTIGYTEERQKLTQANREKFRAKWIG